MVDAGVTLPRRVLLLSPFPPRHDATHGGARAVAGTVAALARRNAVAVLYLRRADEPPMEDALRLRCAHTVEVHLGGAGRWTRRVRMAAAVAGGVPLWVARCASAAFADRVRDAVTTWRPDVVQAELHVMGQYLTALSGDAAVRVLAEHEPSTLAARSASGWRAWVGEQLWARYERSVMRSADAVVVLTERDARAVAPLVGRARLTIIPFAVRAPTHPLDPVGADPPVVVFVGSFVHPPNVDAAEWLAREIFPRARERCPELTLQIVGDEPPVRVRSLASGSVTVTGRVPDVTPYYDRAAVVVAPLRLGGGMRVKVVEALAAGKAVVATRIAAAGLSVRGGEHVLLADSEDELAASIAELATHRGRRAALAAAARAWACAQPGDDGPAGAYGALYEELITAARSAGTHD